MAKPEHLETSNQTVVSALASHEGWLRSVIVARLGSSSGAEDVLQDVHVAAIEQKSPMKCSSALTAWLYQLAVRQVLQFRRRAGRHRKRIAQAAEFQAVHPQQEDDPLSWLLSTERRELIRNALQHLRGEEREILMLKYVEGWSYQRIAQRTGRTERAVESQMQRAKKSLKHHLVRLEVVEEKTNDER